MFMYTIQQSENIRKNLKYLRMKHGLTMKQLSDKIGLSRSVIGYYESYGSISSWRLKIFCDFYNVEESLILMKHEIFIKELEAD